ncbi:MAG TPA: PEP-CTERM sorting domain-containing protein [Tepidisphaeraceae bacterium]|nr:PEP-CTERM sorting domain-containing protein [Tepidisphaeraceae bacterium]
MTRLTAVGLGLFVVGAGADARGDIIWADDFADHTAGTAPNRSFPGGTNPGNDFNPTTAGATAGFLVDGSVGNAAPSLSLVDTGGDAATLVVAMDHFAPFTVAPTSATPRLRVAFDFQVSALLTSTNSNNARFILRNNSQNSEGNQLVIGFSYASLDDGSGGGSNDLALFARTDTGTTTTLAPTNGSAIGLIAGTGWEDGFDFGTYNASNNADNDTNDEFYRIVFDYDSVTGGITGTVEQLSTGNTVNLPAGLALNPGTAFSNVSSDQFLLASTASNTATAYFDNFVVEALPAVPEPGTAALFGVAALGALGRRRRRA